ncbi:MAG: CRISPR-associated endonuclease Cas2 [Boseongicola sp. SB0677_bin_26]|nr:CRISPR-associated endonuclease Cas2 [Boseongicola sp. SB0665_bin_10]MYG26589.1 CRISPR-associated endonuclease Cas2 [Boseongicola sp. SB0677_bin_26]
MLLTYDIADADGDGAAQLRRIGDICSKYGQRVQHSVLEFRLKVSRMARMTGEFDHAIYMERDVVNCCRFPGTDPGFRDPAGAGLRAWAQAAMGAAARACQPPLIRNFPFAGLGSSEMGFGKATIDAQEPPAHFRVCATPSANCASWFQACIKDRSWGCRRSFRSGLG